MYYKIGIDVGGTNTDAVLVSQHNQILAKTKETTTLDISSGIENALKAVIAQVDISKPDIKYIMLGTTHCTNALVERKGLNRLGTIRIALPASSAIPTMTDFPEDLKKLLGKHTYLVHGGYEFDGRLIHPLDEQEIKECLFKMKGEIDSLAITGVFSKALPDQELQVADWSQEILGNNVQVSCSHKIGGLGLLERENATILNSALQGIAAKMVQAFQNTVHQLELSAQLLIGQNDGTLMSLEQVQEFPVHTISSGPTNSIRGAGALSQVSNGIVIDVGGTTSDGGVLVNFFPRESTQTSQIGGVSTNFRMPDIMAVGLGGGTIVRFGEPAQCRLGPDSVGYQLKQKAVAFGGDVLTLTDFCLAENLLTIDDALHSEVLKEKINQILHTSYDEALKLVKSEIQSEVERLIDQLKTSAKAVPVLACGGGAFILPKQIQGASEVIFPQHHEVANAFGACIAQISSEEEVVINTAQKDEKAELENLIAKSRETLIQNGALSESIQILAKESIPLAYLPHVARLKVKLCGDLI